MPLSIFQIPLQKMILQAEFHPRNNSIIILYADGELQAISTDGKENWNIHIESEPISFRINAAGDLIAILGKNRLFFYSLLTLKISHIDVDEKIQLMEFYKDSVLLGGYQNNIILVNQTGSILKNIQFDSLIRQFRTVPATDSLIIYNQAQKLICADMDGNILWQIENLIIHKEIQISPDGFLGYFILDPNDLLQFNVMGDSFYEICEERAIKSFSTSGDGNYLLILDSEKESIMIDKSGQRLWEYQFEQNIKHSRLSPCGDFFFTVDNDDVLSLYTIDSNGKNREEFFELSDHKRIMDKEPTWSIRPGGFNAAAGLSDLTVSADGAMFGLKGLDGCIYFYDESGRMKYQTSITSAIKDIGISDNAKYGYVYGGNEITMVDFENDKQKYILFEKSVLGKPIVNYHHCKIFTISRENECLIYDFEGHLVKTVSLKKEYQKGISCEAHGIIFYNEQEITGYSESGKVFFNFPVGSEITSAFYRESQLICSTREDIIRIDLSTRKGKRKSFEAKEGGIRIVSVDPFLVVTGDKSLYHLDRNLSIIEIYPIESSDSHFYIEDGRLNEIVKNYNGIYCYNDKKEMIWRYNQEDRVIESALMQNGIVFCTGDTVRYIEVRKKEVFEKDFFQYLEI